MTLDHPAIAALVDALHPGATAVADPARGLYRICRQNPNGVLTLWRVAEIPVSDDATPLRDWLVTELRDYADHHGRSATVAERSAATMRETEARMRAALARWAE